MNFPILGCPWDMGAFRRGLPVLEPRLLIHVVRKAPCLAEKPPASLLRTVPLPMPLVFFADSANRKAFRDGIKPGWHYFGRKMVSKERIQPSQLATGKAELFFFCS